MLLLLSSTHTCRNLRHTAINIALSHSLGPKYSRHPLINVTMLYLFVRYSAIMYGFRPRTHSI